MKISFVKFAKRRKGQIFIIMALLIILSIGFFAPAAFKVRIGEPELAARLFFDNIRTEFPHAIDFALAENSSSDHIAARLREFYDFASASAAEKQLNISLYYILGVPTDDQLNVTVGNLYFTDLKNINITVNGASQSIASLSFGQFQTLAFPLSGSGFANLTYTLQSDEKDARQLNTSVRTLAIAKFRVSTELQLLVDTKTY